MRYRWIFATDQSAVASTLVRRLGISPLLARCLANRGFVDPEKAAWYLYPRLRNLSDPFQLPGMRHAVDRLWQARKRGEKLLLFGDYDADGVTATAILILVLRRLGWEVDYYLPHRLEEGYGLSLEAVQRCFQRTSARLWIAVDCGSNAHQAIAWLRDRGVEVIVLDHHQVAHPPPQVTALINPQLASGGPEAYPWGALCSAGLAFKMAHALVKQGREDGIPEAQAVELREYLDLVALGTVADLVPLTGENRILVWRGMQQLNASQRVGLRALSEVASVGESVGPYEIGFMLAPRLNAVGRLEDASDALELLLTEDAEIAERLARRLDRSNRERQELERSIATEVIETVRQRFNPKKEFVIVEGREEWHVGVIGIVASRVLQTFYRPTIIFGGCENGIWRGSGRSVEGFDLAEALRACSDLLVKHGGHAMAAGVTIEPKYLDAFRDRLNRLAAEALDGGFLQPPLWIDTYARLEELSFQTVQELNRLQPIGQSNPPAHLCIRRLRLARPPYRIGRNQQHLRLFVTDGQKTMEAVWWGGAAYGVPKVPFDLVCVPEINSFHDMQYVRLRWIDWRPAN